MTPANRGIEKLASHHAVTEFDCGRPELNRFLQRHALQNQQSDAGTTYVALNDEQVVGFYTLVVGAVKHAGAPPRLAQGLGQYPIPIMILARLAVDHRW